MADALKVEARLFALVRDKDGRPKIDNPETLPPEIRAMLTPEERKEIYGDACS